MKIIKLVEMFIKIKQELGEQFPNANISDENILKLMELKIRLEDRSSG